MLENNSNSDENEICYSNKKLNGLHKTYHDNGMLKLELHYINDKLDGLCKAYHDNGQLDCEGYYVNDHADGIHTSYYPDGIVKSITCNAEPTEEEENKYKNRVYAASNGIVFVADLMMVTYHGLHKHYYNNTQLASVCEYNHGIKDGIHKEYYEDGSLKLDSVYKDGKLIKSFEYPKLLKRFNVFFSKTNHKYQHLKL